ncbi:retron St85 family RNA-directed DNA polymerase [Burkholderia cenocepacia]|uniref:retron St85 family RNA-directed DNA polymerase n=1 Tax=Burkholderia cenocepacia TaxID=95486 RepID=UPI002AB6F9AE|nr:retron St85 family RNA-directed DNA polymerase [Burkholderia cenocepacia]
MALKDLMLESLPFTSTELDRLIETAPLRYKEYEIPKKNSDDKRPIAQPTPEVKLMQRWLMDEVLRKFKIHHAATAYRKGIQLVDNVRPHANNRFMLKLDFRNFFPSIISKDFTSYLVKSGWRNKDDIHLLCNILFKFNRRRKLLELSIGAPSSPMVSNFLMFDIDQEIYRYCKDNEITYTRYADDLTFSTNRTEILRGCKDFVVDVLDNTDSPLLRLNTDKIVETSVKRGRRVTGLGITSDNKVSIGREKKRELRLDIYRYINGYLSATESEALRGYLAFLKSVEPEHIQRLQKSFDDARLGGLLP